MKKEMIDEAIKDLRPVANALDRVSAGCDQAVAVDFGARMIGWLDKEIRVLRNALALCEEALKSTMDPEHCLHGEAWDEARRGALSKAKAALEKTATD